MAAHGGGAVRSYVTCLRALILIGVAYEVGPCVLQHIVYLRGLRWLRGVVLSVLCHNKQGD